MPEMPTATERATTGPIAARTPGPWTTMNRYEYVCTNTPDHEIICELRYRAFGYDYTAEANAHLISAAPDLLEAAKLAYLRLPTTAGNADALDALARAIAKAAGAL